MEWLRDHDPGFVALRRAGRAAVVMPAIFAFGDKVIGNATVATFAAFGSFALLVLVDFGGSMRERLESEAGLAVAGALLVCLGTLVSQSTVLAVVAMTLVAFGVLFAGVVSSVLAGAATSLLLSFILPVSLPAGVSEIPDRLAGWGLASGAALVAITILWPAPVRNPLRAAATTACRALAARLRADVAVVLEPDSQTEAGRWASAEGATLAVAALAQVFLGTPYRPTGLSTGARTLVRLVDELRWLNTIALEAGPAPRGRRVDPLACDVKLAAAHALEQGADQLDEPRRDPQPLRDARAALIASTNALEESATARVPSTRDGSPMAGVVSALDPAFRAQELSFVASQIAGNIDFAAAADRRSWLDRLLGRQPEGLATTLAAAQERAGSFAAREAVWLQNSVRGAIGLGLAVLVSRIASVDHAFWVVLGTLSVLRSSALNTGQTVVRALLGTLAGFVAGALVVYLVGTNTTLLWFLLPIAVLLAGLAPSAIGFAAGQAAFTLTLLILFNILQPEGWRIGLVRIEDIALGCGVSLIVGVFLWPRGASAALGRALAAAYAASARYLAGAVEFAVACCDGSAEDAMSPGGAADAAAASRRLDDAFRSFLAERGAKPVPMAEVTSLVTGVVGLRLAGDAVLDLWRRDGAVEGDRTAATRELLATAQQITDWYDSFAASLVGDARVPYPLTADPLANDRIVDAISEDLRSNDGRATATGVRVIWTSDELDVARRLQATLVEPARAVVGEHLS